MVNKFIRESCRFWIEEYHLSGFRFDLMGLIDNQTMIDVYRDCVALDPQIMIYGEPWTGGAAKLKAGVSDTQLREQTTVQESLAQDFFCGSGVRVGAFNDVIRNAIHAEREWMLTEFWEEDPKVPPISDVEDLVLEEGEFVRRVAAIVKFQEGWEE